MSAQAVDGAKRRAGAERASTLGLRALQAGPVLILGVLLVLMAALSPYFLTGRNLATWTKYRGVDPENDYTVTGGGDAPSDFQTVGPATYWIARISLGF